MKTIGKELTVYLRELLSQLTDIRVNKNLRKLIDGIIKEKTTQLKKISNNSKDYDNLHNLLNGELKNVVDVEKINSTALNNSLEHLVGKYCVIIIHDVSDIRKPESDKLECLGWVRDLEGHWIRGYSAYCSVMINPSTKHLNLLSCVPYSNGDPDFVSETELAQFEKGKLQDQQRAKDIEQALEAKDNYNSKSICKKQIISIHNAIKAINPDIVIIHLLDRGYDSQELMDLLDILGDRYYIRFKQNRNSNEQILDDKGKEVFLKLAAKTFANRYEQQYKKIQFKKKVYQNPKGIFEWDTLMMSNSLRFVLKIRFYDSADKKIFKEPMLIITNVPIKDENDAIHGYEQYLKRPKIEGVFKFLKEELGWEEFRIHDFESIKNLVSLAFFVGGYFYENEDELTKDRTVQWIAELGGGKGKVTRYYFMQGIKKLIQVAEFKRYIKDNNITQEEIQDAYNRYTLCT